MLLVSAMLAQIGWTFVVLILMGRARVGALKARETTINAVAVNNSAWPDKVKAVSNNFTNQFETPVLFFVLCGLALYLGAAHWLMVVLAWLFVGTRIAHTLVHTGDNNVMLRFRIYMAGVLILLVMWLVLIARVAIGL